MGAGLASSSGALCVLVPCALLSPAPAQASPGAVGLSRMRWHRLPGFPVPAACSVVAHFLLCGFTHLTSGKHGKRQPEELSFLGLCYRVSSTGNRCRTGAVRCPLALSPWVSPRAGWSPPPLGIWPRQEPMLRCLCHSWAWGEAATGIRKADATRMRHRQPPRDPLAQGARQAVAEKPCPKWVLSLWGPRNPLCLLGLVMSGNKAKARSGSPSTDLRGKHLHL